LGKLLAVEGIAMSFQANSAVADLDAEVLDASAGLPPDRLLNRSSQSFCIGQRYRQGVVVGSKGGSVPTRTSCHRFLLALVG
jgi:hypothetical protein